MKAVVVARVLIVSSLVAAHGLASAGPHHYQPHRHHHHHHHHRGPHLGKWALGLAVAVPLIAIASHANRAPEPVYVAPPPPPPVPVVQPVYVPSPAPARSAPVIYPRNGQSYQQQEFDQRECNGWATTQQAAMADASVFHRAVEACMDGRGYTMR